MSVVLNQKQEIVQQIKNNFEESKAVIFYNYHWINNAKLFPLRQGLKKVGARLEVYKNTLIKKALIELEGDLKGANAVIFCRQDEYQPLKILSKFDRENFEQNKINGGIYQRQFVPAATLEEWAKLPSKEELLQSLCYYLTYHLRCLINLIEQLKNIPGH